MSNQRGSGPVCRGLQKAEYIAVKVGVVLGESWKTRDRMNHGIRILGEVTLHF